MGRFTEDNPGKPEGAFSLLAILKRQLQQIPKELKGKERKQYAELLVKKQLHKAIVEGDDASIRLIWNYVEGMPKQDFGFDKDKPLIVQFDSSFNNKNKKNDNSSPKTKKDN